MKAKILVTLVLVAMAAAIYWRIDEAKKKEAARQQAMAASSPAERELSVRVVQVQRRDVVHRATISGAIRPRNEVEVFTKLPGRLESVNVKVGDKVNAGQTLAVVEHREVQWQLKQAEASVALAEANLDQQRTNLQRTEQLHKAGSVPDQQLQAARTGVAVASAQRDQTLAAKGLIETSLSNARIVAPISGTITRKSCNVGTQANTNTSLFQIQDMAEMKVEAGVDSTTLPRLVQGSTVAVEVDAYPGQRFEGRLAVITPALDPITRRATIEVALPNPDRRLLANMFARGTLELGNLSGALTVPAGAVVEEGGEMQIFAVREGRVVVVNPHVLASDGEVVAVDGVTETDVVAIQGQKQLHRGARVKPVLGNGENG